MDCSILSWDLDVFSQECFQTPETLWALNSVKLGLRLDFVRFLITSKTVGFEHMSISGIYFVFVPWSTTALVGLQLRPRDSWWVYKLK
jgi:hypothetical protein